MKHPKEIVPTEDEVDVFRSAIQTLEIDTSLKTLMSGLLDNHIWLQYQLNKSKMSMTRLKSYCGIKSEKHTKASSSDKETPSSEDETDNGGDSGGASTLKPNEQDKTSEKIVSSSNKKKDHGRYPADDYTGAAASISSV